MAESEQLEKTVDVFISYSRRDKIVADRIHQRVTQRGLSCFYDTRSINVGDLWRDELYGAIMSARTMILIISRNSLDSKEVLRETNKAINYETMICPIVLGTVDRRSKLCRFVDEYHWLESTEPPSDEELERLVERVAAIVGVDRKVPEITVAEPRGGETFQAGETYRLAWSISVPPGTSLQQIGMELLQNGAPAYAFPGKDSPWAGSVRECQWTVPSSLAAGAYQLRIHAIDSLGHVGAAESAQPIVIAGTKTAGSVAVATVPQSAPAQPAAPAPPPVASVVPADSSARTPQFRVIEPAAKARWTRGRTEVVRLELTVQKLQSVAINLVSATGTSRPLANLNHLQLQAKLSQAASGGSVMIPVVVPRSQVVGTATLQTLLHHFDGSIAAQADVPLEIAESSSATHVSQFQQDESIGAGIGFAAFCAMAVFAVLLFKQCQPVVAAINWNAINVTQSGGQMMDAVKIAVGHNFFLVAATAILGGVLVAGGTYLWMLNWRRWLGGMLVGAGWGAGIGLGLSALGAEGPQAPQATVTWPLGRGMVPTDSPLLKTDSLIKSKSDAPLGPSESGSQIRQLLEGTKTAPQASPGSESAPLEKQQSLLRKSGETGDEAAQRLADQTAAELFPAADSPALGQNSDSATHPRSLFELLKPDVTDSSPDWHKAPITLSLHWILWGALIGAVIGCVSPLINEKT